MGRSVFIDDSIEENILKLYGVTKWATGILIGQTLPQRDYVVHLALTPTQRNGEKANEIEELESEVNKQRSLSKTSVQDFDEDWFVQHCRQVNHMLTGGLKVLGIFIFGPPEKRNKLQVKFRQVLYMVHKMILSDLPLGKLKLENGTSDQVILQVCSTTKKTTCFSLDVSDSKASVHPADVKYQNFVLKWHTLHCSICLQLKFTMDRKSKKRNLYSSLKAGISPLISKIANSLGVVNGVLMGDDQLLVNEKKLKYPGKSSSTAKNEVLKIDLYFTEIDFDPFIERKHGTTQVVLLGTFESQAYVNPKATVKEAINAIKCDVIRNLITRCQLLCEDLDEESLQGDQDADDRLWTLPKRIFAPICGGALKVSDYIFKDEEPKDVLSRFSELLGISVSEEDLLSKEEFSESSNIADLFNDPEQQVDLNLPKGEGVGQGNSQTWHFTGVALGVITVVLAAGVMFFWGDL